MASSKPPDNFQPEDHAGSGVPNSSSPGNSSGKKSQQPSKAAQSVSSHAHVDNRTNIHHAPVLRRTVIRPGAAPDAVDSGFIAERLTTLTHELANLLDGSMRCLGLARRAIENRTPLQADDHRSLKDQREQRLAEVNEPTHDEIDIAGLAHHLETVQVAMQQMAVLVRASISGFAPGFMNPISAALGSGGSLSEAVRHAVDVMRPVADESRIELACEIDERLDHYPAGPIYSIVASAIRNSIESIQRLGPAAAARGNVLVQAVLQERSSPKTVEIQVIDDGEGPPSGLEGGTQRLFDFGVSTKARGMGVGLAVARDVIQELGGSVTLSRRPTDPYTQRSGAILTARFPCHETFGSQTHQR